MTDRRVYTITETIAWQVEADTPQQALKAFMDANPLEQYGSFEWELANRFVQGPDPDDPRFGQWWHSSVLEAQIAAEEESK